MVAKTGLFNKTLPNATGTLSNQMLQDPKSGILQARCQRFRQSMTAVL